MNSLLLSTRCFLSAIFFFGMDNSIAQDQSQHPLYELCSVELVYHPDTHSTVINVAPCNVEGGIKFIETNMVKQLEKLASSKISPKKHLLTISLTNIVIIYPEIFDLVNSDEGWCDYLGEKPSYECEFTHDGYVSLETPSILQITSLFKKYGYPEYAAKETAGYGNIAVSEMKRKYPFLTFPKELKSDFSVHDIQAISMEFYQDSSSIDRSCQNHPQSLRLFIKNNKYGYRNAIDEVVIKPQYKWALQFEENGFAYADGFFINRKGKVVLEPLQYDNGADFLAEGLRRYVEDGKVGFADYCMKVIIKAQYDWANQFKQGVTGVCIGCQKTSSEDGEYNSIEGGLYGAIDKSGNVIIPITYSKSELEALIYELRQMK